MKKIIFLASILLTAAVYAENLLPSFDQWRHTGPGVFKWNGGQLAAEHKGGSSNEAALVRNISIDGEGYYVMKGKVKRVDEKSVPAIYFISRTEKKGWIFQYNAYDALNAKVGEWTDFAIRAYMPNIAKILEVGVGCKNGKVEVKDLVLEKTDAKNRADNAPSAEYWINMDFGDEVVYSKNIGIDLYGEKAIEQFFKKCKAAKVTGVLWRVSEFGQMLYYSKGAATVYPGKMPYDKLPEHLKKMAVIMQFIDPLAVAVREAKKNGIKLFIWMTLSDEGYKREIPNYAFPEFLLKNPDCHMLDKEGKPWYGTICYSEPKSREYRLNIVKELVEYGADGLYLCTRSHCFTFGNDKDERYGYNKAIVDEYQKRYGVNILKEDFDKKKWYELRAEGIDILIEEISKIVKAKNQEIMLGVSSTSISNGRWENNWGDKVPLHWQKYLQNGWIDHILAGQYKVGNYWIGRETNRFKSAALPHNKLYFWAQMIEYGKGVYTLDQLKNQAEAIVFHGANGGMYHEAINMEEQVESVMKPLGEWYSKQK